MQIVNKIALFTINDKTKYFYSFASKYCNWHKQNEYPIYDKFVEKVLFLYKAKDNFANFTKSDLKDYCIFKNIFVNFREFYKLDYSLKEIDKFLWQYGKELFQKISK